MVAVDLWEARRGPLEAQPEAVPPPARRNPGPLKAGDEVYVRSLERVGILSQIDTKKEQAVVRFGALPMTVALRDLDAAPETG